MNRSSPESRERGTSLRDVKSSDVTIFFEQQLDPEANFMAAFTSENPYDRAAFDAHWQKILDDRTMLIKTVLYNGQVAGHIAIHSWFGQPEVTYWLGKSFWGQGIATEALYQLLLTVRTRPLFARAAVDNAASIRVLEKCGFTMCGHDKGFANARGEEVEEIVMKLG